MNAGATEFHPPKTMKCDHLADSRAGMVDHPLARGFVRLQQPKARG